MRTGSLITVFLFLLGVVSANPSLRIEPQQALKQAKHPQGLPGLLSRRGERELTAPGPGECASNKQGVGDFRYKCVFPFTYNNQVFDGCTSTSVRNGANNGLLWCSHYSSFKTDRWGVCNDNCEVTSGEDGGSGVLLFFLVAGMLSGLGYAGYKYNTTHDNVFGEKAKELNAMAHQAITNMKQTDMAAMITPAAATATSTVTAKSSRTGGYQGKKWAVGEVPEGAMAAGPSGAKPFIEGKHKPSMSSVASADFHSRPSQVEFR